MQLINHRAVCAGESRRYTKMKHLRKIAAAMAAVCIMPLGIMTHADYDISVRMDAVASDRSEYVEFGDVKPVQLDSRTLVPARAMAEAAGIDVWWDQPTQTAILTLTASLYSEKPIERYAAKAISMVEPPMPGLTPVDITAALKLGSSDAVIRYNFMDEEGDYVAIGSHYEMVSKTILIDDGTLMLPIRDSMEIFGLVIGWNQDELCAYVSVPETASVPDDLAFISNPGEGEFVPGEYYEYQSYDYQDLLNGGDGLSYAEYDEEPEPELTIDNSIYLGNFKITHYCPCNICNGGWGDGTAWAGKIIPGQTIGVNPNVIPPLSWVYIEGYGMRRAEDTGSGIGTNHIDVAVANHGIISQLSVVYRDVYLVPDYQP